MTAETEDLVDLLGDAVAALRPGRLPALNALAADTRPLEGGPKAAELAPKLALTPCSSSRSASPTPAC